MRRRTRYGLAAGFGLVVTLSIATPALLAGSGLLGPTVQAAPVQDEEHEESVLEREMNAVKAQLRALRRSLRDPAKDADSLASLQTHQAALLACKDQTPARTAREPEDQRATFVAAYRKEMVVTLEKALEVERLLLDGDHEAAKEAFDALRRLEDPAHERFTDGD